MRKEDGAGRAHISPARFRACQNVLETQSQTVPLQCGSWRGDRIRPGFFGNGTDYVVETIYESNPEKRQWGNYGKMTGI
jgi:hypothetical protein